MKILLILILTTRGDSWMRVNVNPTRTGFKLQVDKNYIYPTLQDCENGKKNNQYCKPLSELVKEGRL